MRISTSRRLAYAPNVGEPLLLQLTVRQTLGSEIRAYREAFGKQVVDAWVGIAQTAEKQVSECMVAGHPGIQANGTKHIIVTSVRKKKFGDYFDLLSYALVQDSNWLDAKQKHRCFGNNLLAQKPRRSSFGRGALTLRAVSPGDSFNGLPCHVQDADNPPDQVRRVPAS